jgi:RHS repeat-associated protein
VRVVFTPTGEVLGRSDYLPFGETLNQSGTLPRQRFTGQERDGEAGMDYVNARNLQTRTGRMNAPDPVFDDALTSPQRWNRYAYVRNNPLRMVDPSGKDDVFNIDASTKFYTYFGDGGSDSSKGYPCSSWGSCYTYDRGPNFWSGQAYYVPTDGSLPYRSLVGGTTEPVGGGASPEIKPVSPSAYESSVIIPKLQTIGRMTQPETLGGREVSMWQCSGRATADGPFVSAPPLRANEAVPHDCPPGTLEWYMHSHISPSPPSPGDASVAAPGQPHFGVKQGLYTIDTNGTMYKYDAWRTFELRF